MKYTFQRWLKNNSPQIHHFENLGTMKITACMKKSEENEIVQFLLCIVEPLPKRSLWKTLCENKIGSRNWVSYRKMLRFFHHIKIKQMQNNY